MTQASEQPQDSPLDWAHRYSAKNGWRVLPIKPGEKRPPMTAWQDAASTEADILENWWTNLYQGFGIGCATGAESGIFVLDVDVAGGKPGQATLDAFIDVHGDLPETPMVVTPSGGLHYYFKWPEQIEIRNDAGRRLGEGLDIRGEGGQVVAPPTIRGTGAYQWANDPFTTPLAEAPKWLLDMLAEPDRQSALSLPVSATYQAPSDEDSPAARFNDRTTWAQLLEADGWQLVKVERDGEQRWVRPGKDARDGISATVGHGGGEQLTVFTSSLEWLPEGSYSRFGYYACRSHAGDRSAAASVLRAIDYEAADAFLDAAPLVEARLPAQVVQTAPDLARRSVDFAHIVDWGKFWDDDQSDEDWLAYPLIPRGRAIALFAPAKAGKSTITLAVAAAAATGRKILGYQASDPVDTLYMDYEMTASDLQQRLMELGYGPEDDLSRLHYALLPSLPPLDETAGASALLDLCDATLAEFVVIDTFGRAVGGDEDSADTVRAFYRNTGLTLKARGITYLRTDHSGKDTARGQRGSSAKNDDVDLVWKLTREGHHITLERTHSRIMWGPSKLEIDRLELDDRVEYKWKREKKRHDPRTALDMEILLRIGVVQGMTQRKMRELWAEAKKSNLTDLVRAKADKALEMLNGLDPGDYIGTQSGSDQNLARSTARSISLGAVDLARLDGAVGVEVGALGAPLETLGFENGAVDEDLARPSSSAGGALHPPERGVGGAPHLAKQLNNVDDLI